MALESTPDAFTEGEARVIKRGQKPFDFEMFIP